MGPVATVPSALETIECQQIDIALLDVSANGQEAYPVADELKARGIPVVFVSGFSQRDIPPRYRSYAYVSKPFQADEMLTRLEQSLATADSLVR